MVFVSIKNDKAVLKMFIHVTSLITEDWEHMLINDDK